MILQLPELSADTAPSSVPVLTLPSYTVTDAAGDAVPESITVVLVVDVPVVGDVITGAGGMHPLTTGFPDGADPEYVPPH